jgi:hypothetical protein
MSINELRGLYPFSPQDVLNVRSQLGVLTTDGGQTLSNDTATALTIESTGTNWPTLVFNSLLPGTCAGYIEARRAGVSRWSVELGSTDAESGGNAGSFFHIRPFADDGTPLQFALRITRQGTEYHFCTLFQLITPTSGANSLQFRPSDTAFPSIQGGNNVATIRLSPSICIGSTDLMPTISSGNGAPVATAPPPGSMYMRADGATGTRVYIKQTASTWAAIAAV